MPRRVGILNAFLSTSNFDCSNLPKSSSKIGGWATPVFAYGFLPGMKAFEKWGPPWQEMQLAFPWNSLSPWMAFSLIAWLSPLR